ncbi:MAG: DUF3089 domain-containing protein [Thermoleophilaceae bacterium]|nr:DUF3089 domain-containing protein [Thermoleophilaceae bacterium]
MLVGLSFFGFAATPARAETVWLCQPGAADNPCRDSLDTTIQEADGSSRVERPQLPADPEIDCFYVYPTVSEQPAPAADKRIDASLRAIARYQASRFSSQCRVYAPVYRQLTLAGLQAASAEQQQAAQRVAFADVREAFLDYLKNFNAGRGVVLIGHSQGTRMLRALVRAEVDKEPSVRRRLVSGLLLGQNVTVRKGELGGGDFENVPLCSKKGETGCIVAWSAYGETPPSNSRFSRPSATGTPDPFEFPRGAAYEIACTDPAMLSGRSGPLESLLRGESYPGVIGALLVQTYGGPPPSAPTAWVRPADRYTGRCERLDGSHSLQIRQVGAARKLNPSPDSTWGLHLTDVNIALGELVEIVRLQKEAYLARPGPRTKVSARKLRVRRGRVRVPVACFGEQGVCEGTLRAGGRKARFSVPTGTKKVVVLRVKRGVKRTKAKLL